MQIKIIKINAKYENLNIISKGEYLKSKNLQKYIKKTLIKKILKHKKENKYTQKTITQQKVNNNFEKGSQGEKLIQKKKLYQKRRSNKKQIFKKNTMIERRSITKKSIQNIQSSKSNKAKARKSISYNQIPEKFFINNLMKEENIKEEKFKKTELKSLFNKNSILELEEKKEKNTIKDANEISSHSIPKRKKTKKIRMISFQIM